MVAEKSRRAGNGTRLKDYPRWRLEKKTLSTAIWGGGGENKVGRDQNCYFVRLDASPQESRTRLESGGRGDGSGRVSHSIGKGDRAEQKLMG